MKNRVSIFFLALSLILHAQYQNVQINSSGNDHEEVSIAVNPANPQQLAAGANIRYFYSSSNGGVNWSQKNMSSSLGVWGDPCLLYDAGGYLYYAHLSNPASGYWIDRIVVQRSTDNGATWNDGTGVGLRSPKEQDKEWLAVNLSDGPNKNQLYMTWTEFDNYGSSNSADSSRIRFSKSTNRGTSWTEPVVISDKGGDCIDSDNTVEGAVPCVGPNGEVYVSWAGPLGLMFDRSLDGGEKWERDVFVSDIPGGWDFDVPGIQRCNGLPITACDTSRLAFNGNIYIVWGDQRNGASNTDVWFIKSTDKGRTWFGFKKVNDDNTDRHQFFPWMTIDQTTGFIYVVFYDRRATTGSATDVYVARSRNGGTSFENFKVSNSSFTPTSSVFFGDYSNIAAYDRKVFPMWMRLSGTALSVWTAPFTDNSPIVTVDAYAFTIALQNKSAFLHLDIPNLSRPGTITIEKRKSNSGEWILLNLQPERSGSKFIYRDDDISLQETYFYRVRVTDADNNVLFSSEAQSEFAQLSEFALLQNYPNPFNSQTTISFVLPEEEFVSVKIYDMLGNEAATLFDAKALRGVHEVDFNAAGLPGGVYFCHMRAGNKSFTNKISHLK